MAVSSDPASSSKTRSVPALSTMLDGIRDTVCRNIDAEKIWEHMSQKKEITNKRKIKKAVRSGKIYIFYGVVSEFDLKTFVAFVEVIRDLSATDEKLYHVYHSICDRFKNWGLKPDPEDVQYLEQLNTMIKQFGIACFDVHRSVRGERERNRPSEGGECCITGAIEDIVLADLKLYSPEVTTFYHSQKVNILYSHIHGVIVMAKGDALPVNSVKIVLTVNDYSRPIHVPEGYNAFYSALISLRCDPNIDSFLDYVSVSIPHCAVGDVESLCLLSGSDADSEERIYLREESDIVIESVDGYYFTYRTIRFCANKLAVRLYRRHKCTPYDRTRCSNVDDKSETSIIKRADLELDEIMTLIDLKDKQKKSPKPVQTIVESGMPMTAERNAQLCETMNSVDSSFVAIRYIPRNQTTSWKGLLLVTYDNITCCEEADGLAKEILQKDDLVPEKSEPFVFMENILELHPDNDTKNEWHFFTLHSPALIVKSYVKNYFDRIDTPQSHLPIVNFDVQFTSDNKPKPSMFSVEFKKSSDCHLNKPVSLRIPCAISERESASYTVRHSVIKIIGDIYNVNSQIHSLEETFVLNFDDYECRFLFCEISFQLPDWISLANLLKVNPLDIRTLEVLRKNESGGDFQVLQRECTFQMLRCWACEAPTLSTLLKALSDDKIHLEVKGWTTTCTLTHASDCVIDNEKLGRLSITIQNYWKFVARLIGMTETEITTIQQNVKCETLCEKTAKMLVEWERRSGLPNRDKKVQLFKALCCLEQHLMKNGNEKEFRNALEYIRKW